MILQVVTIILWVIADVRNAGTKLIKTFTARYFYSCTLSNEQRANYDWRVNCYELL